MASADRVLLFVIQICIVSCWEPQFFLGRPMFGMRSGHEYLQLLLLEKETGQSLRNKVPGAALADGPVEKFFYQKLDHFDPTDTATWRQRYFQNSHYYNGTNVVFLMIGGEGPENIAWVANENYPFVKWAKQYGAIMFALEHRFYGESRPTTDQSVENLRYLSSRQALEDLASFIKAMNKEHNLENPRWITFGGSYPGDLSLWARQKYPDLIAGAVGSSAPVDAVVDFWGYLDVVENALRSYSNDCAEKVREGFATIENLMLTPEGRNHLSDVFVLEPKFSEFANITYNDKQFFYMTLFGKFQEAVQYSEDNMGRFIDGYGIPQVCKIMTEGSDPLLQLQNVNKYMSYRGFTYTSNSYQEMIEYLRRTEFGSELDFDSSSRSWLWQTCTEFGYYQSTDGGPNGIFGTGTPLTLYFNMCADVFGDAYNSTAIAAAVHRTQMEYGGSERYKGTNVVIPNGSVDPWHALGKYTSNDISVVWYLVNGTAHCADMYPPSDKDKPGLKKVRILIEKSLDKWLKSRIIDKDEAQIKTRTKPQAQALLRPEQRKPFVKRLTTVETFPEWKHNKRAFLGRPPHGLLPPPDKGYSKRNAAYKKMYFLQPFDHFDNQNPNYFEQQVLVNSQWAKSGGPNFLKIGGESPQTDKWVANEDLPYLQWAKKYGATVHSLEHRYYGESIVGGTSQNPNPDLKYLSSLQMLYDIADYIQSVNYHTKNSGPWIVFGGSYAGNLAAWARQLFPELITGAVGSSAPVEAKLDFYEYLEVVEKAIRDYNTSCADNIKQGFANMHKLALTGTGRKTLSDLFKLVPPWDKNTHVTSLNLEFFFSNIYGQFQGAVQYSGDNTGAYADGYGIPEMCGFMTDGAKTPIQNIASFNEFMVKFYSGEETFNGTENSYSNFITNLKESRLHGPKAGSSYLWTWQTCTEFGYFQSSDTGSGMFGSPTPVNLFTRMCIDLFGKEYTAMAIQNNIDRINHQYGGRDFFNGTNVVIPNGSIDPWHALGLYEPNDPSVVSYLIKGTAHCADMYPPREQDLPDLVKAREIIEENIDKWLRGTPEPTPEVSPSLLGMTLLAMLLTAMALAFW
ncbi:unnamed protein product [Cylicocyclus nassatus]|uniref:Uncharacterized protein n=1 Tax=Cylicocyclus nassatus TaxID=53992 RepID=A0AA36GPB7_CYLNA|nr:unnamed protein product [Cylicocyclus nassatus]